MNQACTVADCDDPIWARDWCSMHYTRWYRHGDPTWQNPTTRDLAAPLAKEDAACCQAWASAHDGKQPIGYCDHYPDGPEQCERRAHRDAQLAASSLAGVAT